MKKYGVKVEQLGWSMVKEGKSQKHVPAKRVDIVSLRLVKETSLLYKDRAIRSPEDGYNLFKQFLGELDREYFVVMCLNVKNDSFISATGTDSRTYVGAIEPDRGCLF